MRLATVSSLILGWGKGMTGESERGTGDRRLLTESQFVCLSMIPLDSPFSLFPLFSES